MVFWATAAGLTGMVGTRARGDETLFGAINEGCRGGGGGANEVEGAMELTGWCCANDAAGAKKGKK